MKEGLLITRSKFFAVFIALLVVSATLIVVFSEAFKGSLTRVACMGDSITELTAYPADLQDLLGDSYSVGDFGYSGSTALIDTSSPYIYTTAFLKAEVFLPDIVVIMLGTNDARADNYQYIDNFVADYEQLVREVQTLKSNPKIYLVKPPPIFHNNLNLSNAHLLDGVIPGIEKVAKDLDLPAIDVYTPLVNHSNYFMDGVHPNNNGAGVIASEIYKGI
jgi:acyl-CoA thioesterase-1